MGLQTRLVFTTFGALALVLIYRCVYKTCKQILSVNKVVVALQLITLVDTYKYQYMYQQIKPILSVPPDFQLHQGSAPWRDCQTAHLYPLRSGLLLPQRMMNSRPLPNCLV